MDDLAVPRLTLEERDRRWNHLRVEMASAGFDCIIAPYNTGHWGEFQADVQYITHMGGNDAEVSTVFPIEGDVTAWVNSAEYIPFWLAAQKWVTDIRNSAGVWAPGIVDRVKELGMERASIGVVGLDGMMRAAEGTIPFQMMSQIRDQLPLATFTSATSLVQDVRSVKSEEEIGILRHAASIAELAHSTMAKVAKPGVTDALVYAEAYATMLRNGGEVPTLFLWCAAPQLRKNFHFPTNRPLQPGDLISSELEAKYCGYRAAVTQPIAISYFKDPYRSMLEVAIEAFDQLSAAMVPGAQIGQLWDLCEELTSKSECYDVHFSMHGRGLGEDRPLVISRPSPALRSLELNLNNVFILKPSAKSRELGWSIAWGDTVVVKSGGAIRLGSRPKGIVLAGD